MKNKIAEMAPNKMGGKCETCGTHVPAHEGYFIKREGERSYGRLCDGCAVTESVDALAEAIQEAKRGR